MGGEAFLVAFLQVLVDKLAHREVFKYFGLVKVVNQNLKKWSDTLSAIGAVLNDAEERQLTAESNAPKLWLDNLRDLAFDVEDVLDKYHTKMLERRIQHAHSSTTSKVWTSIPNGVFNFKMNSEIQKITDRLQELSERKDQLSLRIDTGMSTIRARPNISPSSSQPDGPVIGRDEDKRQIVELLSKQEHRAVNFDVVAIVGMAGVGKTTLAGQVLKDMVATQTFQPAIWVCVSDDFNLGRVTKQILESITSRQCATEDYNKVQDDLHKELAGKKFLIVLDDVWKTCSYGDWMKLQSPFRDGAQGSKIIVTTRDTDVSKMMGAAKLVHNLEPMENDVCLQVFEHLRIDYREGLTFPPNLTSLYIWKVKSYKSLWELELWGLHRLTSLRELKIFGEDPDTVSFPPDLVRMETLLPKSLTDLMIEGFPNLKKLSSKGFQFLTSLQSLTLWQCPKLASIPEEGLPPSLESLWIVGCPVLEERCQPGKGRYWHKISHIPPIQLQF